MTELNVANDDVIKLEVDGKASIIKDCETKVIDLNEHYIDIDSPATYIQGIYDIITNCYQNNKVVAISNYYMADGMTGDAKPGATIITFFPTNLVAGHDELEHDCYLCWLYHDLLMGGLQFIITNDDYIDHYIV